MKSAPVTLSEAEQICFELAQQTLSWNEPIPGFNERFPGKLESCLSQPFQEVFGKVLYKGIYRKAAMLFYLLCKNHPFQNGNKRLALTITDYFLMKNDKFLLLTSEQMYLLAKLVAESDIQDKDVIVDEITLILQEYSSDILSTENYPFVVRDASIPQQRYLLENIRYLAKVVS